MRSCNASNRSAVYSNLTFDLESVHKELQNSFGIDLLLVRVLVWSKLALLRLAVTSAVPDQHVAVTSEEEVEPVSVGGSDHPLVNECIWIAHYNRRLVEVLLVVFFIVRVQLNQVTMSGWEEHAVYLGLVPTLDRGYHELLAFKGPLHYFGALVQVAKDEWVVAVLVGTEKPGTSAEDKVTA